MHYKKRLNSQVAGNSIHSLATKVEQITFLTLIFFILGFLFDWKQPVLQVKNNNFHFVDLLLLLVIGLWIMLQIINFFDRKTGTDTKKSRAIHAYTIRRLAVPMIVWLTILILSTAAAPGYRTIALKYTLKVISSVLIAWVLFDLIYSSARQQLVAKTLAISGLTVAVLGVMELANFAPLNAWLISFRYGSSETFAGIQRISATLLHPNYLAMVMEITLPLLLAWFLIEQRKWAQTLIGAALFVEALAMVLTLSRGGLIATIIGLLLITVIAKRYKQRKVMFSSLAVIGTLLLLAAVLVITNPFNKVRLISEGNNELWYRVTYQVPNQVNSPSGKAIAIPVTVKNTGLIEWEVNGEKPVNLSYHLIFLENNNISLDKLQQLADKPYIIYESIRTSLPENVPPDKEVNLLAQVNVPSEPGMYVIEWDMIQESVTWFSEKNAVPALTYLTVTGTPSSNVPPKIISLTKEVSLETPGRLKLWSVAWEMFRERPLLGIGRKTYHANYSAYAYEENFAAHTHNLWIGLLAETGIVGFFAFLWMLWRLLQIIWRGNLLHQYDTSLWIWWLACLSGITSWFVHGFVDTPDIDATVLLAFWIVVGLILSIAETVSNTNSDSSIKHTIE